MEDHNKDTVILSEGISGFLRKCVYSVLRIGPIPRHIAFIMDGNRRYAKKYNLEEGTGHKAGYLALMNMLRYCYELQVKYVTIYAFSIDNFKRQPEEVDSTMKLIHEKIEELIKEESIVNRFGVRIHFIGNLNLLSESMRLSADRAMKATACNSKAVLCICIAYTSTDEIVHAVEAVCEEMAHQQLESGSDLRNKYDEGTRIINVGDVEKHMYMSVAPDPDIIIRTSGETRLSNFLLWQSGYSLLYSLKTLWPEIGFWHLLGVVIDYQRHFAYLDKKLKHS